jgi:peroxiredoxin
MQAMKRSLVILTTLLATTLLVRADAQVGKPAPDFTVKDINGKTHQLAAYKGKIVVIEGYNLDCPYVANHYNSGAMQDVQETATGQGVIWLVVNSSYPDAAKAKKEVASKKIKATAVIHDPKGVLAKPYGLKTTPHMIVIDKQGKVAYNGAIDDKADTEGDPRKARNYVKAAIAKLSANETVTVAKTKPYGCGYKYAN